LGYLEKRSAVNVSKKHYVLLSLGLTILSLRLGERLHFVEDLLLKVATSFEKSFSEQEHSAQEIAHYNTELSNMLMMQIATDH